MTKSTLNILIRFWNFGGIDNVILYVFVLSVYLIYDFCVEHTKFSGKYVRQQTYLNFSCFHLLFDMFGSHYIGFHSLLRIALLQMLNSTNNHRHWLLCHIIVERVIQNFFLTKKESKYTNDECYLKYLSTRTMT